MIITRLRSKNYLLCTIILFAVSFLVSSCGQSDYEAETIPDSKINSEDEVQLTAGQTWDDENIELTLTRSISGKRGNTGCVGNFVWYDENANGIQELNEKGMPGAHLLLKNLNGNIVDEVISSNGYYKLCSNAGKYTVSAILPQGYAVTKSGMGDSVHKDSDADPDGNILVDIISGKSKTKYDIGMIDISAVTDTTPSEESDKSEAIGGDGYTIGQVQEMAIEQSGEDQEIAENTLADVQQITQTPQEEQIYTQEQEPSDTLTATQTSNSDSSGASQAEQGCVGNLVWLDTNGNGVHDASEKAAGGVELWLLDESGQVADQQSSFNGYYSLCSTPGIYTIRLTIPSGYAISPVNVGGNEFVDSDSNSDGEITAEVVDGKKKTKYDFGLVALDSIERLEEGSDKEDIADNTEREESKENTDASQTLTDTGVSPATSGKVLFGPWVENRHRNDGVFQRFNAALLSTNTANLEPMLLDARKTGTSIFLQLGLASEWGWSYANSTSTFTVAKWKASISRFGDNAKFRKLINDAINDGVIRGLYLMDEPHHKRWSHDGSSNTFISNADLDSMAAHVKSYWPQARTSVRASPRTLFSYGRDQINWQHLDEAFLMINFRKWARQGQVRTIEGFMEREVKEAIDQGLKLIGSIQMLIGAPTSDTQWWPDLATGVKPVGKLKTSPLEISAYVEAFLRPRDHTGAANKNGTFEIDSVMVFRWDRNEEDDWEAQHYSDVIDEMIVYTDNLD